MQPNKYYKEANKMFDKVRTKAYTPKGVEPDAHERFAFAPTDKMMDEWREHWPKHAGGHYKYEMMFDIYAGIEDPLMRGAIETHAHIFPDYVPRSVDMIQYAIDASKIGMRAVMFKEHFFTNTHAAWAVQYVIDEMVRRGELEQGIQVFGSINLAFSHHPDQVRLIAKYPNLGAIFLYTMTGAAVSMVDPKTGKEKKGKPHIGPELPVLDSKGKVVTELKECFAIAAENDIPIITGHKPPALNMALVEAAHEAGCKILVQHAGGIAGGIEGFAGTIEQSKEMIKLGAYLEVEAEGWLPSIYWPCQAPDYCMEYIRAVGAENCIGNTDLGQLLEMHPVEGFKLWVRGMLHWGITEQEIKMMIQTNPAKFLGLDT
jgi:hypothetical protein